MATKYEIRHDGKVWASDLTLKQAAKSPVAGMRGFTIHDPAGEAYVARGHGKTATLVLASSVPAPMSAAKADRVAAAIESQMATARILRDNPNAYGTGSDDDAIEDLGVGTRDGGMFRG